MISLIKLTCYLIVLLASIILVLYCLNRDNSTNSFAKVN